MHVDKKGRAHFVLRSENPRQYMLVVSSQFQSNGQTLEFIPDEPVRTSTNKKHWFEP
jgi:hypothetical protein